MSGILYIKGGNNMPLIPCRGHERRIWLCREYEITPIAHLKLLEGQNMTSCAGGNLTDSYFRFRAVRRGNPDDNGDIICGYPTGCDFCELLDIDRPPLFNPLIADHEGGGGGAGGGNGGNNPAPEQWDPVMLQLSNAIMILLAYWPYREDSILSKIQEEIRTIPDREPRRGLIKSVNTMLRNTNTTLRTILNDIERNNGRIRNFQFNLLIQVIEDMGLEQHFENL
jgi:hypothetical protein